MPLLVTITKAPESVSVTESSKSFSEQGGSLGRGKDNTWVLDDPERFLSSCHCQISSENGQFYLTDMSTNGTFFNGAVHPMGKGTKLALNDGNVFVLGDYEFSANVSAAMQGAAADPFSSNQPASGQIPGDDVFSSAASTSDFGGSDATPFGGGYVSSSESLFGSNSEETDPLAALDKARAGATGTSHGFSNQMPTASDPFQTPAGSDPFAGASHSDQSNPLNEQISWPDSTPENGTGSAIPDDWDDDFMSSPSAQTPAEVAQPAKSPVVQPSIPLTEQPLSQAPVPTPAAVSKPENSPQATGQFESGQAQVMLAQKKENERIQSELKILKQQISAQSRSPQTEISVDSTLIEAMGLHNKNLVDEEIKQINKLAGEVVREMVSGLMQVLGSRSSIKNEFRMNVTTIQPVENNPLKFSANVDDALENMFIKEGNAYKKPVAAVQEGFEGIAEHQVAILAGIRAAFKGVIERFDPVLLEQRFVKQKKGSLIPGSQKAKNWECYLEYYNDLAGDIDNSFQYLFGDEFVKAYEDQLQKLTIARKTQKTKTE